MDGFDAEFTDAAVCLRLCGMFFFFVRGLLKDKEVGGSQRKHECSSNEGFFFSTLNVDFDCVVASSAAEASAVICALIPLQSAARSHSPSSLISGETEGCVSPL